MFKRLPISFKILIVFHALQSVLALLVLVFYSANNVILDNGVDVVPLKLIYTLTFFIGIVLILLFLYTKKIIVICEPLFGLLMIISGISGNLLQIIIGIVVIALIINKNVLNYAGFISSKKRKK